MRRAFGALARMMCLHIARKNLFASMRVATSRAQFQN